MKKAMIIGLVMVFGIWAAEARDRHRSISINTDDEASSDNCMDHLKLSTSDFTTTLNDDSTSVVPNQPLTIRGERNGGIQVTTWDKAEFSIKLCKQVAANNQAEANRLLQQTRLQINGGDISVSSPESSEDHVLATLIMVKAPRHATVSLSVHNGGISLRHFEGTAQAVTQNGGVSLKQSTGKLTVEAENGGVSIQDCGGDVSARVQNGGLSITLPEQWNGKGLDARTHNGGMEISVPRNFGASLEVTGSEYVPITCRGDICDAGQRTWDNGHKTFRLGSSGPEIRATTVNGGVVIQERSRTELHM